MQKLKILFVCVHNSARSQMAEALLRNIASDRFEVESAGLEPRTLNPLAVAAMKQIGIDISQNKTQSVSDLIKQGKTYDYVVTVCDESSSQRCPFFPGESKKLHWGFVDPASFSGSGEQKLEETVKVREQIKQKIQAWLKTL